MKITSGIPPPLSRKNRNKKFYRPRVFTKVGDFSRISRAVFHLIKIFSPCLGENFLNRWGIQLFLNFIFFLGGGGHILTRRTYYIRGNNGIRLAQRSCFFSETYSSYQIDSNKQFLAYSKIFEKKKSIVFDTYLCPHFPLIYKRTYISFAYSNHLFSK